MSSALSSSLLAFSITLVSTVLYMGIPRCQLWRGPASPAGGRVGENQEHHRHGAEDITMAPVASESFFGSRAPFADSAYRLMEDDLDCKNVSTQGRFSRY